MKNKIATYTIQLKSIKSGRLLVAVYPSTVADMSNLLVTFVVLAVAGITMSMALPRKVEFEAVPNTPENSKFSRFNLIY